MSVYEKIQEMCNKKGVTIAELERNCFLSQGSIAKWKVSTPKADSIVIIANYFNVSTDYVLGLTEEPRFELPEELKDVPVAFFGGLDGLTQDDINDVIKYMEFLKSRK